MSSNNKALTKLSVVEFLSLLKMTEISEQQICMKFFFKLGKDSLETIVGNSFGGVEHQFLSSAAGHETQLPWVFVFIFCSSCCWQDYKQEIPIW